MTYAVMQEMRHGVLGISLKREKPTGIKEYPEIMVQFCLKVTLLLYIN